MSSVRRSFDLPVELAARLSRRAFEDMTTQRAIVEAALEKELGRLERIAEFKDAPVLNSQLEASRRGTMDMTAGAHTQARAVQALSRGLFRSTGLSGEHGDDRGDGEGVGE